MLVALRGDQTLSPQVPISNADVYILPDGCVFSSSAAALDKLWLECDREGTSDEACQRTFRHSHICNDLPSHGDPPSSIALQGSLPVELLSAISSFVRFNQLSAFRISERAVPSKANMCRRSPSTPVFLAYQPRRLIEPSRYSRLLPIFLRCTGIRSLAGRRLRSHLRSTCPFGVASNADATTSPRNDTARSYKP